MKSYFLDISPQKNSGLCNQIYAILFTSGHALRNNINFIFLGKFLMEINTTNYCKVSDIIDLNVCNLFFKNYNLCLIDYYNFEFNVVSAKYGTDNMCIDVTSYIKQFCISSNKFNMMRDTDLNNLNQQVVQFFKDKYFVKLNPDNFKLYITFSINNIHFQEIYEQQLGYLKSDIIYDFSSENVTFKPSLRIHNDLSEFSTNVLKNIVFQNEFILKSARFIEKILNEKNDNDIKDKTINCIHLRLEDDAVQHWSKENNMSGAEFKSIIEDKYIEQIKNNINKDEITVVLSHNYENKVIQFLRENNYNYILTPKMSEHREIAAIYDLQIGQHCNNVFILVYESSFSYTLLYRMDHTKIKPVQLIYVFS